MRVLCFAALTLVSAVALADQKGPPTIVVLPFEGVDSAIGDVGHAAALMALGAIEAENDLIVFHPKQLNRTMEYHEHELGQLQGPKRLEKIASWLGAYWVVSGTVKLDKQNKITVTISDATGKKVASKDIAADDLMVALKELQKKTIELLVQVKAKTTPIVEQKLTPLTDNRAALLEYAACHSVLIRQPIGVRDPVVLEGRLIDEAIARCGAALEADPGFADAQAALGLAWALKGNQKQAEQHLASVKAVPAFLPLYVIGKFWVLSRYYDANVAADTLKQMAMDHPGFLLARGYLGDALNTLGRSKDALEIFESYLAATPQNPWVMSRIGYTYAKLGDHEKAIEWTKKALRITPADSEILLEMSGRMVDAGRLPDAAAILKRIVQDGGARGEVHLRLGYVSLLLGKYSEAEKELVAAIQGANPVGEWRTRGRARYDLAKLWMKQNVPDNALRQLEFAIEEGFHDPDVFAKDPDLKPLTSHPRFKQVVDKGVKAGPEFISPYPVDAKTGDFKIAAGAKNAAAIAF